MKYYLIGHDNKHAVEEMLYNILPAEKNEMTENIDFDEENLLVSSISEEANIVKVKAYAIIKNKEEHSEIIVNTTDLSSILKKREINRAIKTTIYHVVVKKCAKKPVWGKLTGVRPSKLVRSIYQEVNSWQETERILRDSYYISKERVNLAMNCAKISVNVQNSVKPRDISIYVAIPFCPSRCSYCSFVSHAIERTANLVEPYLDVYVMKLGKHLR